MKPSSQDSLCPVCGGTKRPGKTTFTAEMGFGIVVVRDVPAMVCTQCAEEWICPSTASDLERITDEARKRREQFAVLAM